MKLVGFTTVNGNPVYVNPEYVASVHRYGSWDSEINLSNGIDVQVKGEPEAIGLALVHGAVERP